MWLSGHCTQLTSSTVCGLLVVKLSLHRLTGKYPFCHVNLSLITSLTLIIVSWVKWGDWWFMVLESVCNGSQWGRSHLKFIYTGGSVHHSAEVLFVCLANPITLVHRGARKQLYLHWLCLSGPVSICCWTARWSLLFNSFSLDPLKANTVSRLED